MLVKFSRLRNPFYYCFTNLNVYRSSVLFLYILYRDDVGLIKGIIIGALGALIMFASFPKNMSIDMTDISELGVMSMEHPYRISSAQ